MFRRAASLVPFVPADGQRVELRGRLDLYAPRGELQLVVESLERVGQGTLYEELLRLRAGRCEQQCKAERDDEGAGLRHGGSNRSNRLLAAYSSKFARSRAAARRW